MNNSLLNMLTIRGYQQNKNIISLYAKEGPVIPGGFYVIGGTNIDCKIDDPGNEIYCLECNFFLEEFGFKIGDIVPFSTTDKNIGPKQFMKKVKIVELIEKNIFEMSNGYLMEPCNTFISFVHYPQFGFSGDIFEGGHSVSMILYLKFLEDPEKYTKLASRIRDAIFSKIAVSSLDNSVLKCQLNSSDNEFGKEILKRLATDVNLLDISRRRRESKKREEERIRKQKQADIDEYIRQCEFYKQNATKHEENVSHYKPITYSRKR